MKVQKLLSLESFIIEKINFDGSRMHLPRWKNVSAACIHESGNAINDARPINQEEAQKVYGYVKKNIYPILGLDGEGIDASPIGSFGKKVSDQLSGDIDIAVSVDKIASANNCSIQDALHKMQELLIKAGYSTDMRSSFNQISVGVPIPDSNDTAQVDLMLSTDLNWSSFMYHSPDFTKAESKYKGLYRNLLLMSIIGQSKYEVTKSTASGETEEYKAYVIQLNKGIVEVQKTFMGKKGNLVKNAIKLEGMDRFITNTPDDVAKLAVGNKYIADDIMTFESLWGIITSNDFIYKDKLKVILEKYRLELIKGKFPFPSEAVDTYPQIFTIQS